MTYEINKKTIEEKAEWLVKEDIYYNATWLVNDLIRAYYNGSNVESIDVEELESLLYDPENDEYIEVCQWWVVSEYLGEVLQEIGDYIVVDLPIGYLWGRKGCGYALSEDMEKPAEYIMNRFNERFAK